MSKLQKRLIIAFALLILFNLATNDDWKSACLPAAMLVNMWLSAKEKQLSKPIKVVGFSLVFVLIALGGIYSWRVFSKHI